LASRAAEPMSEVDVTGLLRAWSAGEAAAGERLMPLVYQELKRIARSQLGANNAPVTLQATELVNEAYVRLAGQNRVEWSNRAHFFALAATIVRRILLDHARRRYAQRRDRRQEVRLEDSSPLMSHERAEELLQLESALERLQTVDARRARLVELRYFGGLNIDETATILNVSPSTVKRDWHLARAWLYRALQEPRAPA